jgi:hypothetical protein
MKARTIESVYDVVRGDTSQWLRTYYFIRAVNSLLAARLPLTVGSALIIATVVHLIVYTAWNATANALVPWRRSVIAVLSVTRRTYSMLCWIWWSHLRVHRPCRTAWMWR